MQSLRKLVNVDVQPKDNGAPFNGKYGKKVLGSPESKWKSFYTQQGDCIPVKCGDERAKKKMKKFFKEIPESAKKVDTNVLLRGSTNIHSLFEGEYQVFNQGDQVFFRLITSCVLAHMEPNGLNHAEHHGQWLPPGDYYLGDLFETDHINEERRIALD